MTKAGGAAAQAKPTPAERRDWRVERLVSLMGEDWLAGEWDPRSPARAAVARWAPDSGAAL